MMGLIVQDIGHPGQGAQISTMSCKIGFLGVPNSTVCQYIYMYIIIISFVRKLYYSNMDKSYFHDYTYLMPNDRAQAEALTPFSKV